MMMISRKVNERLILELPDGSSVVIRFISTSQARVRMACEIPKPVKVVREDTPEPTEESRGNR